jgi:hypothetical protein
MATPVAKDLTPAPAARGTSWPKRLSRILTLVSVACLLVVPLAVAACHVKGDVPDVLPHRRTFYPVFTTYEMACFGCLLVATMCGLVAFTTSPTWKRAAWLATCVAGFLILKPSLNSLRGHP